MIHNLSLNIPKRICYVLFLYFCDNLLLVTCQRVNPWHASLTSCTGVTSSQTKNTFKTMSAHPWSVDSLLTAIGPGGCAGNIFPMDDWLAVLQVLKKKGGVKKVALVGRVGLQRRGPGALSGGYISVTQHEGRGIDTSRNRSTVTRSHISLTRDTLTRSYELSQKYKNKT